MGYKVSLSPRAQQEIEDAIDYYVRVSSIAPTDFVKSLEETYQILSLNPHFRVCYSIVRTIPLRRFPYSLFYVLNEKEHKVKVLSCFHTKLHPKRRPTK